MTKSLVELKELDALRGAGGHTEDETFAEIIESLGVFAILVEEREESYGTSEVVTSYYRDKNTKIVYELWYQVRTADSPEGRLYAYGFARAS